MKHAGCCDGRQGSMTLAYALLASDVHVEEVQRFIADTSIDPVAETLRAPPMTEELDEEPPTVRVPR